MKKTTKKLLYVGIGICLCLVSCSRKASAAAEESMASPKENVAANQQPATGCNIGDRYIDLEMPSPAGDVIRVSDYVSKNKYTLIDFWASWCGPCRAEMPTVVKAYTDYHGKGFEVMGVSFDNNAEAWQKAIEMLHMPWPQMSDLKGWECIGAQLYRVRAIPSNVLIDQQGIIVAKDLRGENLLNKMAELLGGE